MGKVEKLSTSEDRCGLALTVYVGQRSFGSSSSQLSRQSLTELVRKSVEMAKAVEEDSFAGLPDKELLMAAEDLKDLGLCDESLLNISVNDKIALAMRAESAALAFDERITNSGGASYSDSVSVQVYDNSRGFLGGYASSDCSLGVTAIASMPDGSMQRDGWYDSDRKFAGLQSPEEIGKIAGQRTVAMLGARKVPSCVVPVIYDPDMASQLLGQLAGAMRGGAIYKKLSFLTDKLGKAIASPLVQIVDDGTMPGAQGSCPFDGEGLPVKPRVMVKDGVLQEYFLSCYSARKLDMKPNSGAITNLYIKPGEMSQEEMIASVKSGLLVTSVSGPGYNSVTGDYSVGASGIWIEDGKLSFPVEEITIAGNVLEMFQSIEAIGNDPTKSSISSPSLKIAKMTVAGS
jgi:PmbA protein